MITALNPDRLEEGFAKYVLARFEAENVQVPKPAGEAVVDRDTPQVTPVDSLEVLEAVAPTVAIVANEVPWEVPGVYGDRLRVLVVAVSPLKAAGITLEDHRALGDAVAACFPARPHIGKPNYAADLATWEALNQALSDSVEAAAGYRVNGWSIDAVRKVKTKERVENVLTVKPCVFHPEVA